MDKYSIGTTENRPERGLYAGFEYYNTLLNCLQVYNGTRWNNIFTESLQPSSIDERNPGIYSFHTEAQTLPGGNQGYGCTLIVLSCSRTGFNTGIQLLIGGKDKKVYIRTFDATTFNEWSVLHNPLLHTGTTAQRPADTDYKNKEVGFQYFDTTISKPIWWTGDTSGGKSGWVDATGTPV